VQPRRTLLLTVAILVAGSSVATAILAWALSLDHRGLVVAAIAVSGALFLALSWLVLRLTFYRAYFRLLRVLERVAAGQSLLRADTGNNEIGALGTLVNRVLHRLTDLSINVIDGKRELEWTQKELGLSQELAEKTRLLESSNSQLESRVRDLNVLFSIARTLTTSLDPDAVVTTFLASATDTLDAARIAILVHDDHRNLLTVTKVAGFGESAGLVEGMTVRPGEGVSGTAFQRRSLVYVRNLDTDDRFLHFRGKVRLSGSAVALPLLSGDRCNGVMLVNRQKAEAFTMDDISLFHVVASQLGAALANALLFRTTQELASHDQLTGLHNRRSFEERLDLEWERATRFSTPLACLMLDVDHFKRFNDEHGHLVGDEVLRHVGSCIQAQLRKVDFVARYGGEEFVILLPRTDSQEAAAVAEKLRESVAALPLVVPDHPQPLHLTISVGVAASQAMPQTARQLVDFADIALLDAKSQGRNRVTTYGK